MIHLLPGAKAEHVFAIGILGTKLGPSVPTLHNGWLTARWQVFPKLAGVRVEREFPRRKFWKNFPTESRNPF
jgi:hypothetical protein